jgi:glycosyltransferase involved in cell wall biosynthesis
MASRPTVSVVIPTYNQARFLAEAVESALGQSEPPLQVIIVDDGSTDDTPAVLEALGDAVLTIRKANAGVAAARNSGARAARGDLLAFLDSDDRWMPTKLERQVDRFVADPRIGLAHCGLRHIDAAGNPIDERLDGQEGDVKEQFLLLDRAVLLAGSSTMTVRRDQFEMLGGFDERLAFSADWDLGYRIARTRPIAFVPEPLLEYRIHGAHMSARVDIFERDMLLALGKAFLADPEVAHLRRRSFGRLHRILAGVAWQAGERRRALTYFVRSLAGDPTALRHGLGLPARSLRRARGSRR